MGLSHSQARVNLQNGSETNGREKRQRNSNENMLDTYAVVCFITPMKFAAQKFKSSQMGFSRRLSTDVF